MKKYWFIYSVDTITTSGEFETYGMIMDHEELHDVVDNIDAGTSISSVIVAMYDNDGELLAERDITCLFASAHKIQSYGTAN